MISMDKKDALTKSPDIIKEKKGCPVNGTLSF
jgi:hypothetical protein